MTKSLTTKATALILTVLLISILLPALSLQARAASIIYVDSNTGDDTSGNGTAGSPYKSFTKGYTQAVSGDTLHLTGTFNWNTETGDDDYGYPIAKSITITGPSGDKAVVQAGDSLASSTKRIFSISYAVTVTLQNLELKFGSQFNNKGGAIMIDGMDATVTIDNCYIHDNAADISAGAIMLLSNAAVTIQNTTIASNEAITGNGGAVVMDGGSTLTLTNTTIYDNYAGNIGGGITVDHASCTAYITNCTITDNTSHSSSFTSGAGICQNVGGTVYLKNNIIANNTDTNGEPYDYELYAGTLQDNGYNIIEAFIADGSGTGSLSGTDITGSQANLFGTGQSTTPALDFSDTFCGVLPLSTGSPAINAADAGTNGTTSVPSTDQRGADRDAPYDIGAYELVDVAPTVSSINRQSPSGATTTATSVTYRVTFSEGVTGVDTTDFTLTKTGTADGAIASVSASSTSVYDVTVNTISGEGTLRLDLDANGTGIADIGGTAIATGYTSGETYTVDSVTPTLVSAARNSDTQITVALSEDCQNLAKSSDGGFTVTKTGTSTTYTVSATAQGTDASRVVLTVADMASAAGAGVTVTYTAGANGTVADLVGNALATDSTGVAVSAWDTTAPTVQSINRQSPAGETTNATSVTYRVTFSEGVTGVDTADFTLTKTGTADGTVSSISASSGTAIDVTVNSISGDGTLRLDLNASGTGIADIGGTAIATGYTSGQTYTIDQTAPTLQSAARDSDTQITVALSEDCQNLAKSSDGGFTVTKTGTSTTYAVSATARGTDDSRVVLTVADMATAASAGVTVTYTAGTNGTVADLAGNALATDSTGVAVSAWDTAAPTVQSINRQSPAGETTTATSVTYRVTFSEGVTGVDATDFTLTKTGTADGTVASISASSTAVYDVTVNTISGEGTLRLDLYASGTGIADIGGTGIATGFTSGQTYTVDSAAPTLVSAARNSDTQITVALSENCQNLAKSSDGGFTVTKTGTSTTYTVSATAQGTDASHVVLTVADMAAAAGSGVTITYTAGTNGTIADLAGNALATDSTGVTVAAWDTVAPAVQSINRYNPSAATTIASSVVFRVTFSEGVTGVDTADFTLTKTGTADGAVALVTQNSASEYDVTVNTISGAGTLRLDLNASGTGIADVGGTAITAGYTGGQTYTIDRNAPLLSSASRNGNTQILVALSEDCQNLAKANDGGFTVTRTGSSETYAVSQTAQGADAAQVVLTVADLATAGKDGFTVTYTAGANGTIADLAGNAMATDATGVSVTGWDTTAPGITGIERNSNTQITLYTSEICLNCDNPNDGGFTVTQTGTSITYPVLSTAEGSIILTVADMSSAGMSGITVTYTAGGNGRITDVAGNPMESTDTGGGYVLEAWEDPYPQTGDSAAVLSWMLLLLGSCGLLWAGYVLHARHRQESHS